jgi:NAD(P)-dependent dehydrogenase (short-subunit alcohol dehydrogenase family)
MDTDLKGRVALVTGASRGVGASIAACLAKHGAVVHAADIDERAALGMDVTDRAAIAAAVARIEKESGGLDILVNNAGIALRKPTLELSLADWQAVVDVNLNAVFLCSRAAGRTMVAAGRGAIVNVASMMGLSGGGLYPNLSYHSSKGGVVNLTRALAVEWAGRGVRVNAVAPTWVKTEFTQGLFKDPALIARMMAVTPLQRVAEPEDVAHAIVFLASDKAAMITGHTLPVDGGFLAQ